MFNAFMGVWKDAGDDDVPSLIRAMSTVTTEHRQLARAADRAQSVDGRRPKRNFQDKSFRLLREAQKTCFRQGPRQQCLLMSTIQFFKVRKRKSEEPEYIRGSHTLSLTPFLPPPSSPLPIPSSSRSHSRCSGSRQSPPARRWSTS
jgi:hypothetical protein